MMHSGLRTVKYRKTRSVCGHAGARPHIYNVRVSILHAITTSGRVVDSSFHRS